MSDRTTAISGAPAPTEEATKRSDILWVDNSGDVSALLMNTTTVSTTFAYGNVGTVWSVQSLSADLKEASVISVHPYFLTLTKARRQ